MRQLEVVSKIALQATTPDGKRPACRPNVFLRRLLAITAALCVVSAYAFADTVYMRNGESYKGKVIQRDDSALVIDVNGRQVKLSADKVLYVSVEESTTAPAAAQPGAETEPASPAAPSGGASAATRPASGGAISVAVDGIVEKAFSTDDATMPDTMVYMLMRRLASGGPGANPASLTEQIKLWQVAVHDRKRKSGSEWLAPKDFAAQREAYAEKLKEAQAAVRAAQPRTTGRNTRQNQQQQQQAAAELAAAMTKLRQTAESWPDPLLRQFIIAVAALHADEPTAAMEWFIRCRDAAPRVAAFHEGVGVARLDAKQPLEALAEFTQVLRLWPGSQETIVMIQEAMKATPGGQTSEAAFTEAKALVELYEAVAAPKTVRRGYTWLLPGRPMSVTDQTLLPTPLFDRIVFRQGVAVPVGKNTLLVDAEVVRNAQELFVRLEGGQVVPAQIRRLSMGGSRKEEPPLAFVSVAGCEFTPVQFDKAGKPAAGWRVAVFAANLLEEMGPMVRQINTTVKAVGADGAVTVADGLLAGESAAPVLSADGQLVGFLVGKTDPTVDGGGADGGISAGVIADLVARAAKGSTSPTPYKRAVLKTPTTQPVSGSAFVIYATAVERMEP